MTTASQTPLRILFVMRHGGYVRNYESVLAMLAERSHDVRIGLEVSKSKLPGERGLLDRLTAEHPSLTRVSLPDIARVRRHRWTRALRLGLDYLRYFDPEFRPATALRERAREIAPPPFRWWAFAALARRSVGRRVIRAAMRLAERRLGWPAQVERLLQKERPDVLLVTPLVQFGGAQTDYLRSGAALGLPTGLLVASWDNLTNKGLIHELPDVVLVWNEEQRAEAVRLHNVPASHVRVTGANPYDQWFSWSAQRDRAAFFDQVDLPANRPLVLYLTSSPFIAEDELPFVRRWLSALRSSSDVRLREAAVLVRPHPLAGAQFDGAHLHDLGPTVIWPPAGANPTDEESKSDYYDSIFHSAAVVGLNTSGLIESAIVDRPVLTVLVPEFAGTQEGTLHFRYMPRTNGGPLMVAHDLDEHLDQLVLALEGEQHSDPNRRFLQHFVRPHGISEPATPRVVAEIESLMQRSQALAEPDSASTAV